MSKFEQKLEESIASLPSAKQPERDLWRGIELGIEAQHQDANKEVITPFVSHRQWLALAASVCVVTLLWFAIPSVFTPVSNETANYAVIEKMSQQQQTQVNRLLTSFERTPALTEDWQAQLNELDEAASAVKLALKNDPNNKALIRMLHHVYQQQIALIERVHAPKWQQI
jgi:hypothetical protein